MSSPASEEKKLEWKNLIEQQRQSGLSVEKWCLREQVRPYTFRYWKEKLFQKPLQKSSFAELNMKRPDAISLQARGLYVRLGPDCDPNLRKQLFALFAEVSC
jgi:hypothetical protein